MPNPDLAKLRSFPLRVVGTFENVSGMVAGMFWYQYEYTGDEAWKVRVRAYLFVFNMPSNHVHTSIRIRIRIHARPPSSMHTQLTSTSTSTQYPDKKHPDPQIHLPCTTYYPPPTTLLTRY